MKRYIDKDALIAELQKMTLLVDNDYIDLAFSAGVCTILNRFPESDVEERKHGFWRIGKMSTMCSECGRLAFVAHETAVKYFAFCPSCGAKMDNEEK